MKKLVKSKQEGRNHKAKKNDTNIKRHRAPKRRDSYKEQKPKDSNGKLYTVSKNIG